MSSLRALIVAYGWMLSRDVETVLDRTSLPGKKSVKRLEDTALYMNLPLPFTFYSNA